MFKKFVLISSVLVSPSFIRGAELDLYNLSSPNVGSLVGTTSEERFEDIIIPLSIVAGVFILLETGCCLYKYCFRLNCWRRQERLQNFNPGGYGSLDN